mmetsp:Transcript_15024/g.21008  ORF Transcript_15024/g.21008 Transcript_15024/m.21008 type:complete len:80 (-) Transcript_15024:77-316(-)
MAARGKGGPSRAELVSNILELQETLDDLIRRVESVKTENGVLREDNALLSNYIDSLMEKMNSSSNVNNPISTPGTPSTT